MKCYRDLFFKKNEIKTMNIKMAINSQLSKTESKKQKQTKQTTRQEQNHRYGDHLEGYQLGEERGEWGRRCRD